MFYNYESFLIGLLFCFLLTACSNEQPEGEESGPATGAGNPTIEALSAQIERNPDDAGLYAQRGAVYYENEGYDEAIEDLQRALTLDSTNVEYHHVLADVYLDYFKSRLALKTMERAAALYPERIPTLLKLSEFQLILKRYEESMRTIDQILRIDPQNAEAYLMFGFNFKELGDTTRSINSFQKAVELDPDLIEAWVNLGQLHGAIGSGMAMRFFDSALRIDPDNLTVLHAKGDYLRDQGKIVEAIGHYKQLNAIDPQYDAGYYNSGLLYMELDSLQKAYETFNILLNVNPLHIRGYFFRGLAAEKMGNIAQARSDYQQALNLAPEYDLAKAGMKRVAAAETGATD